MDLSAEFVSTLLFSIYSALAKALPSSAEQFSRQGRVKNRNTLRQADQNEDINKLGKG
jgi:hypothetical protein